jgi:hypothetical protein
LDNDLVTDERPAAPVDADKRGHTVLNAVPFTGAGRVMSYSDGKAEEGNRGLKFIILASFCQMDNYNLYYVFHTIMLGGREPSQPYPPRVCSFGGFRTPVAGGSWHGCRRQVLPVLADASSSAPQ